MSKLKDKLQQDVKDAMRSKDKPRLGTLRLILAGVKQREVDERIELDDQQIITLLTKMAKQRRDSITQFTAGGRDDLVEKENVELALIQEYMPQALTEAEIEKLVNEAISDVGAQGPKDMGKVMAALMPKTQGRSDGSFVSQTVKKYLSEQSAN